MKSLKTIAVLLVIILVFSGAMFGLNFVTGPVIEANNAGAVFAPLLAVMPEGAVFGGDAQALWLCTVRPTAWATPSAALQNLSTPPHP